MRKINNNQSGFTLIEIIVVLIILGVLAAIALPSLFSNVTKSRAAEALASLGTYKTTVVGCIQGHPATPNVDCTAARLNPAFANTTNFTYQLSLAPAATNDARWTLTAAGRGSNGLTTNDAITIGSADSSGIINITCAGSNQLAGVC